MFKGHVTGKQATEHRDTGDANRKEQRVEVSSAFGSDERNDKILSLREPRRRDDRHPDLRDGENICNIQPCSRFGFLTFPMPA